ncbi:RNA-directed DNA polymerase from mobile element jockey [Trichonephila inaurata madagascariensis]|uniref:RNA-directed DNA polymerase from mobile element jockey n=1 Tax=Trichonephila inaurata madagascariensis TaxID=2747483 RepID=A0A8X6WUC2_9ARAC|nr:RNA-directed DNA polymerase from mobile element jockey [Trichonephila inaurata madagascariensis]
MSRQRGQTSIELRKLIIKHNEDEKGAGNIGDCQKKKSHFTVHDIIKRYKTNNRVENKSKKDNNKIFTEADERYLVRKVKVNPFLSAPKLVIIAENELGKKASPSTIRNVFHKKNLTGRKAKSKIDIYPHCRWTVLDNIGSDHYPILIEIDIFQNVPVNRRKYWNFRRADWKYEDLTNSGVHVTPLTNNINSNWINFADGILGAAKQSVPRGTVKKYTFHTSLTIMIS